MSGLRNGEAARFESGIGAGTGSLPSLGRGGPIGCGGGCFVLGVVILMIVGFAALLAWGLRDVPLGS